MGLVDPVANDPIPSGRSIQSFRHLEHQNLSIISEDIGEFMLDIKFVTHTHTEDSLRYCIG